MKICLYIANLTKRRFTSSQCTLQSLYSSVRFCSPQYKFWSISASIATASYSECCNIRTDTNCTAPGIVTCLSCVPLLSVIANKTTLRLSGHCPDVSVCHVNSSYTIHCTPHCSSHVSPNKMHDCSYGWLLPSQLVSVFWCKWLHWMQYDVSPCCQIYILCFIQCTNVDLMQWRTVAIRTVWIWIITKWILRVEVWKTRFRRSFVI